MWVNGEIKNHIAYVCSHEDTRTGGWEGKYRYVVRLIAFYVRANVDAQSGTDPNWKDARRELGFGFYLN